MTEPRSVGNAGATAAVWRKAPSLAGRRTAAVGRFRCDDAAHGSRLLDEIADTLSGEGYGAILGPMDGDTWHAYRLVTESDGRAPFAMEPQNPPFYVDAFQAAGFAPVEHYVSSVDDVVAPPSPVLDRQRLVLLRGFKRNEAEAELGLIHALSMQAFARNRFFVPLAREDFLALYRPALPLVDPDFVLIAERPDDGTPLGFLFAMPGAPTPDGAPTLVVKTYASLRRGIGGLLGEALYRNARARGVRSVIHALMHVENLSLRQSGKRQGVVFRRYALFGRLLGSPVGPLGDLRDDR